jgi:hypothetical protein
MLDSWSSHWTVIVETLFKMNIQFCCHLFCNSSVIFLNSHSFSVDTDFCPLFLFAHVVFSWFVYAYITLETVILDIHNNVTVFVTYAPAELAPMMWLLPQSDKLSIFQFFLTDCYSTQSLTHWHEHYRVSTNGRIFSSFSVANINSCPQFLSVSIILSAPYTLSYTLVYVLTSYIKWDASNFMRSVVVY